MDIKKIRELLDELGELSKAEEELANLYQVTGYTVLETLQFLIDSRKKFNKDKE